MDITTANVAAELLDVVEQTEGAILHFVEGFPGDRTLHAEVLVPANYVTDETGGHRIPDAEVTAYNVMNRLGDWRRVEIANVARVERV